MATPLSPLETAEQLIRGAEEATNQDQHEQRRRNAAVGITETTFQKSSEDFNRVEWELEKAHEGLMKRLEQPGKRPPLFSIDTSDREI